MGLDLVPETVPASGPLGTGAAQRYLDPDPDFDQRVWLRDGIDPRLWPAAVFDLITNNADRSSATCWWSLGAGGSSPSTTAHLSSPRQAAHRAVGLRRSNDSRALPAGGGAPAGGTGGRTGTAGDRTAGRRRGRGAPPPRPAGPERSRPSPPSRGPLGPSLAPLVGTPPPDPRRRPDGYWTAARTERTPRFDSSLRSGSVRTASNEGMWRSVPRKPPPRPRSGWPALSPPSPTVGGPGRP